MISTPLLQRLPSPLKTLLRIARRQVGASPIQQVFRELERRGVAVEKARVLEVFGGDGTLHVQDYAGLVGSLEIWELNAEFANRLRSRFPMARVRTGDSFRLAEESRSRFDIVVIDNPNLFTVTPKDLYLSCLNLLGHDPVFVFMVVTNLRPPTRRLWPPLRTLPDLESVLEHRRRLFPGHAPEDIPLDAMRRTYGDLARARGYELEWSFARRRHYAHYLVFKLRRAPPPGPAAGTEPRDPGRG
jgi:hypothetical protein